MADDHCPPQTADQMAKDVPDTLAGTMHAMGIESCKTTQNSDSWTAAGAAKLDIGPLGLGGEAQVSMSASGLKTGSSSTGCEDILAISKKNLDVVNNVKCTLNKTFMATSQAVKEFNSINIDVGGDFEPNCEAGFTIDQQNKVKLAANMSFSDKQINDITETLNQNIKDVATVLQSSKTGYGATPAGKKTLEDISNKSVKGDYKAQIKESVQKMTQIADQTNELKLHVGGNYRPRGKFCTISQSNIAEFVADMVLNESLSNAFKEYTKKVTEYDRTFTQKTDAKGAPVLKQAEAKLTDPSLVQGMAGLDKMGGSTKAMSVVSSIVICIVAIVVGIIAVKMNMP